MRNRFHLRRMLSLTLAMVMLAVLWVSPAMAAETTVDKTDVVDIVLSDDSITVDGEAASKDSKSPVYVGGEIIYYHDQDTYESGNPYGEGTEDEKHSEEEAALHTAVTITKEGTYRISGKLSYGQIVVDLGEDRRTDPTAVVNLILDGADINCTIAPAVIFYNVYESDQAWVAYDNGETEEYTASATQDTTDAGANVILADGSVNNISGSHVARIYKDNDQKKKKYKYDGAFYSVQSMNVNGEKLGTGVLNLVADNEGMDTEMHLTINGGKINIQSQDDGINTNEDGVSVTTINGGSLHVVAGLGSEGDGIDSNGYLVINGGTVISLAKPQSDSGLDADKGSYINGGYVVATGSTMDWAESDSKQVTMNLQFASSQNAEEAIIVTDLEGKVVFAYDPEKDESSGENYRGYQGAVISSPEFEVGQSYNIYVGGDVNGKEVDGLYDVSMVTGFSAEATKQQYTGTDVGMGGPGGERPEIPDDSQRPALPEDGQRPELPDGVTPGNGEMPGGERPEIPDDSQRPALPPDGEMPGANGESSTGQASTVFYMTDKVNAFSGVADFKASSMFTDVAADAWYADDITNVVNKGLMNGMSSTAFGPNMNLTRGMMATILYRMAGSPDVTGDAAFSDVSSDKYYAKAVAWAAKQGIVEGYKDGTFRPNDNMTRGMMVTVLYRMAGSPAITTNSSFPDVTSTKYYAAATAWAVKQGIVNGYPDGTFKPDTNITRAQTAAILSRNTAN
ncbi:S-layer homology domain-containing protein [Paenibacillus polygoni]|uniref:S-layer homology domain-containing protein n=1 Tax=Paenibacillus polygoni TaxID=3050112 RepID=A0ABY8X6C2_9BACL|nr:S-layer homology domain-containing protein [Paenibacillus polygoni]WIV20249.1 S-layer homology domain-containing protein [Paenibacillus polygoni]